MAVVLGWEVPAEPRGACRDRAPSCSARCDGLLPCTYPRVFRPHQTGVHDGRPPGSLALPAVPTAVPTATPAPCIASPQVSMMDGRLFDSLEHVARKVRGSAAPFGGVQVGGRGMLGCVGREASQGGSAPAKPRPWKAAQPPPLGLSPPSTPWRHVPLPLLLPSTPAHPVGRLQPAAPCSLDLHRWPSPTTSYNPHPRSSSCRATSTSCRRWPRARTRRRRWAGAGARLQLGTERLLLPRPRPTAPPRRRHDVRCTTDPPPAPHAGRSGPPPALQRKFCFEAESWGRAVHECCFLSRVFRQVGVCFDSAC